MVRRESLERVLQRSRGATAEIGQATALAVEAVEALEGYYSRFWPAAFQARLTPFIILGAIALASPVSALVLLATLVPFAAVMAIAGGAAGAKAEQQLEALSRLSGLFVDRVRALPVVLAFEAQGRETARVAAAAREVSDRTLSVLRVAFISTAALEFFSALAVAMVAVYCGFSLLGMLPFKVPETLDFPRAFFALALAPEFYAPMRRLAAAYHEKQLGEAAVDRLQPLLETPLLAAPTPHASLAPTLAFRRLRLHLGDLVIGPIDGEAPAGQLTALVGPTGSGKSSLLAAILGRTPLGGGDLAFVDPTGERALPPSVSWAGQTPAFLPGTILDNLMSAAPEVTKDQALSMASMVGLTGALSTRSRGADTILDERGSGLSGGERRRLALARAFLKPSPLLLLDEPTADLDAAAEAEIIDLIRHHGTGRTVIIATHSPAMAAACDRVVSLP